MPQYRSGRVMLEVLASAAISPDRSVCEAGEVDIIRIVAENLRRLRVRNGLSLERLARLSGVSRAMLGQIELAHSVPSIAVLWKVSRALDVPLSAFTAQDKGGRATVIRAHRTRVAVSLSGRFRTRALFPPGLSSRVEFHEVRISPRSVEEADGHPAGTVETLVVVSGSLTVEVGGELHALEVGDAIRFLADVPHLYRNAGGTETLAYLVTILPVGSEEVAP